MQKIGQGYVVYGEDVEALQFDWGTLKMHNEPAVTGSQRFSSGVVIVNPGISCGRCRMCLSGQDNLCPDYHILGSRLDGGYAQYVVVPAANLLPMPQRLDFAAAAAFPLTFLTAWHMLVSRARIQLGETVLVWGGSSGVGSAGRWSSSVGGCSRRSPSPGPS